MVTKYLFALLVLLGTTFSLPLFAHDVVVEVNEVKETGNSHGGGARNKLPSVVVHLCDSELQIQFDGYEGNVTASVYNECFEKIAIESFDIHENSQIIIYLSSFTSGSYVLRLFIGDSIFEGHFVL